MRRAGRRRGGARPAEGGTANAGPRLRRLTTPQSAAWAGVVFAVLFGTSLVLMRTAIPADPFAEQDWVTQGAGRIRLATTLLPIAGIAFLWFIGVVRDRLGQFEDRFFSTVVLGSALLFLAMMFSAAAVAGSTLLMAQGAPVGPETDSAVRFGRATTVQIANVYALRMAAVFMISLATTWLRTGLMPRSVVMVTYSLALALLVVTTLSLWATLVFPGWVLVVSVLFLLRSRGEGDADVPDVQPSS